MSRSPGSAKRKQFPLYLLPGEDAEGQLFEALHGTKRRQEALRDFTLLGFLCARAGIRLDPTKQSLQGVGVPNSPYVTLPHPLAAVGGRADDTSAERALPRGSEVIYSPPPGASSVSPAPAHEVRRKYEGLI